MSAADDGGPAFPVHETPDSTDHCGMTLRDYFAAKAMAAFICEPVEGQRAASFADWCELIATDVAQAAYTQADAMLKIRATGAPNERP